MNRQLQALKYWDEAAQDPDVDIKYITDIDSCEITEGIKGNVLEIGCGVGRLLKKGWHGIDISMNMLDIANRRTQGRCYLKHTAGDIPYPNNTFDWIYCYLVFQHLKPSEIQQYFNEVKRTLKTSGIFRFQFIEGDEREPFSNHYSLDEIKDFTKEAGLPLPIFKQSSAYYNWTIGEVTNE